MATEWKQIIKPTSKYDEHGLKIRRLSTDFYHIRLGFSSHPDKDDKWARWKATKYGGFDSPKWRREYGIDYAAYGGQRIWPLLNKHCDQQIDISDWTKFRIIDQGIRHPTVCLWVAVNGKGDRHVYKEYYATNRSIAMNCNAIKSLTNEPIAATFIDPSTRKRSKESLTPIIEIYGENGISCMPADNSFAGYDKVSSAILSTLARVALAKGTMVNGLTQLSPSESQLLEIADHPALTFDLRFASRSFQECCNLRWQEHKGDVTQRGSKEKPVDVNDDGPDCVRYSIMSELWHKPQRDDFTASTINFRKIHANQLKKRKSEKIQRQKMMRAYNG